MTAALERLRATFEARTKARRELDDAELAVDRAIAEARTEGRSWLQVARAQARAAGMPSRSGAALRTAILALRQRLVRHGQRVTERHAKEAQKPPEPFLAGGSLCSGGSGHSPNDKEKNMAKLLKRITEVYEPEPGDLEGVDAEEFDDDEADEQAANDDVEPEVERKVIPRRTKK